MTNSMKYEIIYLLLVDFKKSHMIYSVKMFRLCSDFSDNVQNFQSMFRICSDNVQTVQSMFRICSEFSVNVQNVQTFSEFLAQKLVYSEFLDFVVEATNTNFIVFALT